MTDRKLEAAVMTCRGIRLLDGTPPFAPVVAEVTRDAAVSVLDLVETSWGQTRSLLAATFAVAGTALEHAHWDWRNKSNRIRNRSLRLVTIDCGSLIQGVMAVAARPRPSVSAPSLFVAYVDYLEVAPWNIRRPNGRVMFRNVGRALLTEAVGISMDEGQDGLVGLHALPQAEGFYKKLGMTDFGPDVAYYDLPYYEFTAAAAKAFLTI